MLRFLLSNFYIEFIVFCYHSLVEKDFRAWHNKKEILHQSDCRVFFHEREIWVTHLGVNVGFEQDGKGSDFLRPVLIIKKFSKSLLWCLPLTRKQRKGNYYFPFNFKSNLSIVTLSQIRVIDAKRLKYKIGDIAPEYYQLIKQKLRQFLA